MEFSPCGKEHCYLASQSQMERRETSLELFWVSFRFLAFLHALNLQHTSCKEGRLNTSSMMVSEGNILILN